jgi:DNA-binding SARP family transcriptional activator/tetratricopeptide (TPR) repeat protein
VLSLHLFGRAHLADELGQPLTGAASQRRTLALLAVLAIAGEAGLSRDKLVGLLWPDTAEERARHSLTQALYTARRALRCEELFLVGPSGIRLNFEHIDSDVRAFEAALDRGDLESAVASYSGPFLDGFFLPGSPGFEQWSSAQRERLQSRLVQSLESLAARAEGDEEFGLAVEWRRRLAVLRPLDSATTVRLMTAMASAGDRAGAIQQARLHATLLRQELELEPDPVVEELASQLRTGVSWRVEASPPTLGEVPVENGTHQAPADAATSEKAERATEVTAGATGHMPMAAVIDPRPALEVDRIAGPLPHRVARPLSEVTLPLWVRWTVLTLVVVALLGAGVLVGRARRDGGPDVHALAVRQRVLVAPFRVVGADPSLAFLRDGMVELLSTRLADDAAARSVDAGAVLGAWRATGLTATMDVPRDTVVELARRLGAERVVVGSVVGTPARMILRAAVLVVPTGAVSAEASISGPMDNLTMLIDRLAGQLLASEAGEDQQLALQTTRSLAALRAYLAGQAALRALDYAAALRHYEVALRRDSLFALAALQAATVADRMLDLGQLRRSLASAWAHRDALNERDRMLLDAYVGPRYPMAATVSQQWAAWQQIVDAAPLGGDLWFSLGSRIQHDGLVAGLPDSRARATEALERASAVQPHPPARALLVAMGVVPADASTSSATLGPFAPFARWRAAISRSDTVALRQLRDTLYRLGRANLRAIALSSQYDAVGLTDGARAIQYLDARPARPAERVDVLLAQHAQAMLRGRSRDALDLLARLDRMQPGSYAAPRLRVLDALYGDGDSTAAAVAARELVALTGAGPNAAATTSESWTANRCVLGQWDASHGDSAAVRRAVEVLRAQRAMTTSAVVSASPGACAAVLAAAHAVLVGAPDAPFLVRRLDSLVLAPHVIGDLAAYAPLLLARLHERLGDAPRALAAVRRRTYMSDWPRYLASMLRTEARLAERTGDLVGMRAAYEHYLAYRDSSEAPAPELSAVRRRLEAAHDSAPGGR